jgi:hypothetical protein
MLNMTVHVIFLWAYKIFQIQVDSPLLDVIMVYVPTFSSWESWVVYMYSVLSSIKKWNRNMR